MEVACGQCLGCRLDRSRMWAMRIIHESVLPEHNGCNCFITLTYDDDHIPANWSLEKKDFQDFMKRLRKGLAPLRIRFFHCGEYGNKCKHIPVWDERRTVKDCELCNVGRPHYHAILFGCDFGGVRNWEPVGQSNGVVYYTNAELQRYWPLGFVQVGQVTFQSAAYVARYVLKKVNGKNEREHYMLVDGDSGACHWVEPEYCTMSRRPGIGRDFFERFKDDMFPSDEVPVPGVGVMKKVPRYYEEIFARDDPGIHEEVKALRRAFRLAHADEYTPSRLMAKYKVKKAQSDMLRREI